MIIRVVDFETSGPESDPEMLEIGWADVDENGIVGWPRHYLLQHEREIDAETMAIHHLQERHFNNAVPRTAALAALADFTPGHDLLGSTPKIYAAHGAKFECACWPESDGQWICTYKCAIRIWPLAPRHSNQVLRYYLKLDLADNLAMPPHRAGPDAYVTAHILARLLENASVADLLAWSSQPALLPRCMIGKFRGQPWESVDDGFLRWILSKEFDEDTAFTASYHLDKREQEYRESCFE